jgi:hypothetical protein
MTFIWVASLGGLFIMAFSIIDQELCIEPTLTNTQAMYLAIFGLLTSIAGIAYGIYLYGW